MYDVDFPEVIEERRRYYTESDSYRMIPGDIREADWHLHIPRGSDAIVVMEGVSMYLPEDEVNLFFSRLGEHFESVFLLMDSYSSFAARMSRRRNPISEVGVTEVYGTNDAKAYECGGLSLFKEHTMIPKEYTEKLRGFEKFVFSRLYAGGLSRKLYRLYEFVKR